MAELGRARSVVVAAIATILTANLGILSTDRAQTLRSIEARGVPLTTPTTHRPTAFIRFGKSDTALGAPTAFRVWPDGHGLSPSTQPGPHTVPNVARSLSHDGTRFAAVVLSRFGFDLWVIPTDGSTRLRLTHFAVRARPNTTFCGQTQPTKPIVMQPMWSPDDSSIAFLSNVHHLATFGHTFDIMSVNADGTGLVTTYRATADECVRIGRARSEARPTEFVSLFGWERANMAA